MSDKLLKQFIREAVQAASPEYMKKETVRKELQDLIQSKVSSGEIKSESDLKEYIGSLQLAITALKMIPMVVWQKMAGTPPGEAVSGKPVGGPKKKKLPRDWK